MSRTYRFAFVMDQQVGLLTQALNLRAVVDSDPSIDATWIPVRYEADPGPVGRLPGVPKSVRGTLSGVREIRDGIAAAGRQDGVLWATWAAKSVRGLVSAATAFIVMDMTPSQMEAMGEHYGYTRSRARFMGGWKRRATRQLYNLADRFFPWNDWVGKSLKDEYGVPAAKVAAISPGVDTDLFHPDAAARSDGTVRLLFVGGDFQRKGGDLLLRFLKEYGGPARLETHVVTRDDVPATPGLVVYKGVTNNSPELIRLYQGCDIFVLPTRADCYSLVAIEAMACGAPVIVSNLGGISNIVEAGRTGFLIRPGDYEGCAAALTELIEKPEIRRIYGENARADAVARFDCRKNYRSMLEMMKQSVDRKAAA